MATILIVDDIANNRKFLAAVLGHQGHRLLQAGDGGEGLARARAELPDLVIADVLMPVMDGYEFVRQLRLDPSTSAIPVLFHTAHYGGPEAKALALAGGVAAVLTKPADSAEVLRIVDRVLAGAAHPKTLPEPGLPAAFDHDHLRLLTDTLSEKVANLEIANTRLRALFNIGLEFACTRNPDLLLQNVCETARDLFGATYVTLGILAPDGLTVRRSFGCGADDGCGASAANWIQSGDDVPAFVRSLIQGRRTMRGDNPGGKPAELQLPSYHPPVETFLAAPIASPDHVYGWICLVGNGGSAFTDVDEYLLTSLSARLGRIYELEHEIAERKQAEADLLKEREALRVAEERKRFALQSANVGIWDLDAATGAAHWSEILEAQYGLEPGTYGGTLDAYVSLIHPDDRDLVQATIAKAVSSGGDFSVEHRVLWPDGTVRTLNNIGHVHFGEQGAKRAIGISIDVTERRALEAQFQQAQKMEAVGRLAGGVAHDFNNLLTVILGNCELILDGPAAGESLRDEVSEIQRAGTRAAGLTRQLLAFSRKEIIEPKLLDLNAIVADTRSMLGRLIGEDIVVVVAPGPGLGMVKADRGQMEQIVMNLAVNARDAMPTGGTLTIATANVVLDESDHMQAGLRPGPYVGLTVSDTGTGMSPQVQSRLFEPFFTTKDVGKGTGLGLATVHGIVTRSHGSIGVVSKIGRGTTFKIYLPRADAGGPLAESPVPAARPRHDGTYTVLVVEDAESLRELTRRLLVRLGYTVLVAGGAEEALRICGPGAAIDVLLTDVVMPGASGPDLARQLVERQPLLRVIYMSGYTDESIAHHGVLNEGIQLLHKPFTSEGLGRKLHDVLDRQT